MAKHLSLEEKGMRGIGKHWEPLVIALFLVMRLLMNAEPAPLSLAFAVAYFMFLLLLLYRVSAAAPLLVLFLTLDSMVGTYLATQAQSFSPEYLGTMAVNLGIMAILVRNTRLAE